MKSGTRFVCLAAIALLGYACTDQSEVLPTDVDASQLTMAADAGTTLDIQDASTGGNANFLWLQPVSDGVASGPLASGLSPEVEICNKDNVCTRTVASETGDHYQSDLKSGIDGKPRDGSPYQIRVYGVGDFLLGSFSVAVSNNGNIPLKFWIGEGFEAEAAQECIDADRCNLGGVVGDVGGIVTVQSPSGGVGAIAAALFPPGWSPGGIDRTITIDCRDDGPTEIADDGTGPLNSGLTQLPWYCDFNVVPALAPGEQFLQAVTVEVCETVDLNHGSVVLGKSSGNADFELLPFVTPIILGDCFADYPGGGLGSSADASGLWGAVGRRLAAVFAGMGPERLYATIPRDGGAGGSVTGFSRINPVIPATIDGTLSDSGSGGIDGITVTLSNGDVTVTSQGGQYSFGGLVDASYTVTVDTADPDFPASETLAANSAVVLVTGSGDFVADFQTTSSSYVWAGTYNTATKFGGVSGTWNPHLPVVITASRQVTIGGVPITNPTVTANGVSWSTADGNSENANFTFLTSSSDTYYWSSPVSGKLFQGVIQFPGSGGLDYRGLAAPSILSATPGTGGSNAYVTQMVTFFVSNVATSGGNNPDVSVNYDIGGTVYPGTVFLSPSSGTQLYVRTPVNVSGTAQVTVTDNATGATSLPFAFDISPTFGTPEIVGTNPQVVSSGGTVAVQTYGGDTSNGEACFTQGAVAPTSGPSCLGTVALQTSGVSFTNYLAQRYTVPTLSAGPVWIQVRAGFSFGTIWSDWSVPIQVATQ